LARPVSGVLLHSSLRSLAKRVGDCKLLADSDCRRVLNFTMSRHSAGALCWGIMVDAVVSALAKQQRSHVIPNGGSNQYASQITSREP
jgi:hypothetical protein